MALLAPVLIWKLRNVNDAHGIRRDLILTAISTMTIDVMFAVSTTLQSKFTFWKVMQCRQSGHSREELEAD